MNHTEVRAVIAAILRAGMLTHPHPEALSPAALVAAADALLKASEALDSPVASFDDDTAYQTRMAIRRSAKKVQPGHAAIEL